VNRTIRQATLTLALIASLGWGNIAHAQTFTNSSLIDILDDPTPFGDGIVQPANPYPSEILVSGLTDPIVHVSVTLHDFWHAWVRDVDILLIGPNDVPLARSWTMLTSDAGGQNPGIPSNAPITITFDDFADSSLTFDTIPSSGVYKPTNLGGGEEPDQFPGTGLQVSRPVSLSTFNGTNGNGIWRLYVVDDGGTNVGNPPSIGQIINGWSITISTNVPEPGALPLVLCGLLTGGTLIARRRRG
jgi:hypothetical protein